MLRGDTMTDTGLKQEVWTGCLPLAVAAAHGATLGSGRSAAAGSEVTA